MSKQSRNIFPLLILNSLSWGAPAFVQKNVCTGTANLTLTCAYTTQNPALNNLLVVWAVEKVTAGSFTVSDSIGNTWTNAKPATNCGSSGACSAVLAYAVNISGAADTITLTVGSSVSASLYITEYSGTATSSPLDTATATSNVTGTSQVTPNITAAATGELIIAAQANSGNSGTHTVNAAYTERTSDASGAISDQTNASTSVTGATYTLQFANTTSVITSAFKPSGSASVINQSDGIIIGGGHIKIQGAHVSVKG